MAGSPVTRRESRRDRTSHEDRQQQLIYLGAAAIVIAVLVIVAIGVVMTVVLPPRAHVLTVGDRDFSASDVADRAIYLVASNSQAAQQDPATEGMESLIGQEVLFQVGAERVGEVTDQEVQDAIAQRLGLSVPPPPDAAPAATEDAGEGEGSTEDGAAGVEVTEEVTTVDPVETPEATPEGYTDEEYADTLAEYLRLVPIGRSELEGIVRAGIIEERLEEQLREELPESGDQLQLWAVPTNDRAAAQRLIDLVRGGTGFRDAAVEAGIAEDPEEGIEDLGWFAPTSLNDRVMPFVQDLQAGEVSEVVDDQNRIGFEVYFVAERTSDQPYQDEVKDQLARRAFNDWREEQETALEVERDLSDDEEDWIRGQVLDYLRERAG